MALTERRVDGTTIACPFVYGSIAYWMGRKADEFATHKWTLYVRGPNMEDMSSFISKVVFTLHPSFSAPIRGIDHYSCIGPPSPVCLSCNIWTNYPLQNNFVEFSEPPYQVSRPNKTVIVIWRTYASSGCKLFHEIIVDRCLDQKASKIDRHFFKSNFFSPCTRQLLSTSIITNPPSNPLLFHS